MIALQCDFKFDFSIMLIGGKKKTNKNMPLFIRCILCLRAFECWLTENIEMCNVMAWNNLCKYKMEATGEIGNYTTIFN